MGVKRCRKVRPFLLHCYACMEMHATHYNIIYPLFCYLKDRAKVIQTFEFTKKRKPEEEDLHLKAYLIFPVW